MTTQFRPGAVDYERQAGQFAEARALSPDAEATWREAIERHLAPLAPQLVLDLGSGTGRFSPLLAGWLDTRVVGVEPSEGMRETASRESAHPSVTYLAGDAENIPLADGTCDRAWLAYMVHHVPDRPACARELVRVLRPGGVVLVVGAYSLGRREMPMFRYFPAALRIVDGFPLVGDIIAEFAGGPLEHVATEAGQYESRSSLREAADRFALRADTTLQLITDEEFAEGMTALEAAAAAETEPAPISVSIDLIVFRRP